MHPLMMEEMAKDRVNNARQQAKAHRRAHQARAARQKEMATAVGKVTLRQDSGVANRLLAAAKQVTGREASRLVRTWSPGKESG